MHQVKYEGVVKYRDFDNSLNTRKYSFFASNEDDANNIVRELFFIDNGVAEDMSVSCTAVELSQYKIDIVRNKLIKLLSALEAEFSNMTYKSFLKAFLNFEGSHFRTSEDGVFFVLTFRQLTCMVKYSLGVVSVDKRELLYRLEDSHGGHVMVVIRDNMSRYLIGEG